MYISLIIQHQLITRATKVSREKLLEVVGSCKYATKGKVTLKEYINKILLTYLICSQHASFQMHLTLGVRTEHKIGDPSCSNEFCLGKNVKEKQSRLQNKCATLKAIVNFLQRNIEIFFYPGSNQRLKRR